MMTRAEKRELMRAAGMIAERPYDETVVNALFWKNLVRADGTATRRGRAFLRDVLEMEEANA